MGTVSALLYIARREIGNTESPPNSNGTKYGAWYGMNYVAWCQIFCQYCFSKAGVKLPIKTASCGELMRAAQSAKCWVVRDFQPGDVVIYDFSGKQLTTEHCGIVEQVLPEYGVQAIEGNTSVSGSQSNGGMVCRKSRPYKYIIGAVRPTFDKEVEEDMDIPTLLKNMTDAQAYELLQKAQRHAATLAEPAWSQTEGNWAKAKAKGVINGDNPEGLIKRDEIVAVLGRIGLLE